MLEGRVRQKFVYELGNQTDLEHATYIRSIEPNRGSSQESCAASIRGALMFGVSPGDFEEPFDVHERNI